MSCEKCKCDSWISVAEEFTNYRFREKNPTSYPGVLIKKLAEEIISLREKVLTVLKAQKP